MTTLKYKAYFSKHKLTTVQQLFLLLLHTAYVVLSHIAAIKEEFTELIYSYSDCPNILHREHRKAFTQVWGVTEANRVDLYGN